MLPFIMCAWKVISNFVEIEEVMTNYALIDHSFNVWFISETLSLSAYEYEHRIYHLHNGSTCHRIKDNL